MSLLDAFSPMMETVTWKHLTSIDQYGDPTYTEKSISVIWFGKEKIAYLADRTEILVDAHCMVQATDTVVMGDVIVHNGFNWPVKYSKPVKVFGSLELYDVGLKA
jgi:hypothetical protein